MTINSTFIDQLSDQALIDATVSVATDVRRISADLIALLAEVDARRLYLPEGCASMFAYCTQVLHFSEHEAFHRIEVARASRRFPVILDRLRDGSLTQTSAAILGRHLTAENADALIEAARYKSKREVEMLVTTVAPKPDAKTIVRLLPESKPIVGTGEPGTHAIPRDEGPAQVVPERASPPRSVTPEPRPLATPLSADRYLLRVTLSADAHAKLRRAQDLLRHSYEGGDPAAVVERALSLLVADLERRRMAQVKQPRLTAPSREQKPGVRYVPAPIRREVWHRDAGRCAFVGRHGRCRETGALELHHVEPFALGGPTSVANLELRCRAHNQYEGSLLFGDIRSGVRDGATPTEDGTRSGAS